MEDHFNVLNGFTQEFEFPSYRQQQQQPPSLLSDLLTTQYNHLGLTPAQQHNNQYHCQGQFHPSSIKDCPSTGLGVYFNRDLTATTTTATHGNNWVSFDGGDAGATRWPRMETLTLLEIRTKLDHKFKEANQKGPLWDEVARIMCEEHGFQRSGKKCREKFENLYKYYKKTKEGKGGRQDGKHYRFFRQLEALYGDHPTSTSDGRSTENTTPHNHSTGTPIPPQSVDTTLYQQSALFVRPHTGCHTSVSLSNCSNFDTSSESNESMEEKKKKGKRSWKAKTKEFIDLQMREIMEKQESWVEKMMKTLENREYERMVRGEEWMKQENDRVEREHKFWANERAWVKARDSAILSTLEKLTNNNVGHQWHEHEVTRLIQVRTSMEPRFQQNGSLDDVLWDEIAAKMGCLGYNKSAIACKEKWHCINKCFHAKEIMLKDDGKKKRKENYGGHNHNENNVHNENVMYMNQLSGFSNCEINNESRLQVNEGSSSSPSSHNSNGNVMNDSCLKFFMLGDGDTSLGWENNYGVKLNKVEEYQSA